VEFVTALLFLYRNDSTLRPSPWDKMRANHRHCQHVVELGGTPAKLSVVPAIISRTFVENALMSVGVPYLHKVLTAEGIPAHKAIPKCL